MRQHTPECTAICGIQHQRLDPTTMETSWIDYETIHITASSINDVIKKAHLYMGRPERIENVLAIQLTGTITIKEQEPHPHFDHKDSVSIQIHMLRERNIIRKQDLSPTKQKKEEH